MSQPMTRRTVLFLVILLNHNIQTSHGLRVLGIHAFQMRSHHVMCEELFRGLAAKGHQVDVYGHYPLKKPEPNLTDFSLKGLIRTVSNNVSFEEASKADGVDTMRFWIGSTQHDICQLLGHPIFQKLIHNPPKDPPYDVIITELSIVHCYNAFGRHLNIPIVGVVTLSMLDWQYEPFGTPINLAMEPTTMSFYHPPMTFWQRLDNFIGHYRMIHMFYQVATVQDKYVEKYFGPGYGDAYEAHKDVSLVLVNHDVALAGTRAFAPKVIPVGGLHVVDRNEPLNEVVQKWLDESTHGCVYFSFGSFTRIETFPKHILNAFYKSFENIKPVRVLLKIAHPEELPPGLPSNVLTQTWFQQVPVLKHKNTKVFVTHGGLMGGQEAIYFGVPMVAVPLLGDQRFNSANYVRRKIAVKVWLSEITEKTFTHALKEVLHNPIYRNSMKKFSIMFKDHPLTPMQTAIYWIEYVCRHGKDALKSPSEDLLWWQKSLLDIYAFLCGIAIVILFVSIQIVKIIMNLTFEILKKPCKKISTMLRSPISIVINCILVLIFMITQRSDALRILGIFPFNMRSHFVMCEELLKGLAAKGHQVDVYSHFPLKESVKNYHDFSLLGTIPALSNNVTFEDAYKADAVEMMRHWFEFIQEPMCGLLGHKYMQKLIHNPPRDPPYDLFITELSIAHCFIPFGRHLNVPVIGMVTPPLLDWHFDGFGTPANLATDPSIFSSYAAPMTFFERLGNVVLHERMVRTFRTYASAQDKYVKEYFGSRLPNVYDLQKDVSLVLVNHDVSLSGMMPFAPKVIPVGGLHVVDRNETLPQAVQKWLDESTHGCIYFSFGSFTRIETFPRHIIEAFYKSIDNIAPVRALLKIAKPEELPPGLPSNAFTQPWLQQIAVLKHKNIKAFVTHGGLMSGQEAIRFGVPMIGVPLLGDQWFNVKNYVRRNIGIEVSLPDITESTFTNALNAILKNPKYRESAQKLSRKIKDRPLSLIDTAIFWVEYIHRNGKDALKSPIDDMHWWEASLLDVYAFIVGLLLLILYVIYRLTYILIKFFSFKVYHNANIKLKNQ
ncbi:uncharacterized protein LOC131663803 [Phymastichus coffea]|uniref:uncharacterized protein LOC131663803 n=1 Tax=Phymastichus coffea TaxID=108790 RepID=UPI00273C1077|nr:uncharacterized protein LOC131663803 [Phymastichus coffea]